MSLRFSAGIIFSLTALLVLSGCNPAASILAAKIFRAPNRTPKNGLEFMPEVQAVAQRAYSDVLVVPVKNAVLGVAIIDPGSYELGWAPKIEGKNVWIEGAIHFAAQRGRSGPKGLILMLHGFGCCKEQMLPWALDLASAGYRVALVDLRGHGASTGEWIGFGALEKNDLKKVLDGIDGAGLGGLPVGILGVSYGASIGLSFAAEDRRVSTVVALEPFSSAAVAIPEIARAAFPQAVKSVSDRTFEAAFRLGARRGEFVWEQTDTSRSMKNLRFPILLVHGADDTWVSPDHSRRLQKDAPLGSRLIIVPGENHISLPLRTEYYASEVRAWFDTELSPQRRDGLAAAGSIAGPVM